MAGYAINASASMMCPHGGTVIIAPANEQVTAAGGAMAVATDTTTVAGCTFTLPGPKPSPCVTVQWVVADTRVKLNGVPTISQGSSGICFSPDSIPQGPVVVQNTQPNVSTQ